jgi:cytochrome c peroxidase
MGVGHASPGAAPQALIPIPLETTVDTGLAALGRRLFFDARLSADGRMSCASCHDPEKAYTDGRARSVSRRPETAQRQFNVPTLLNVSHNFAFGWRAQHETLEAQVEAVIHDPDHLGADWSGVLSRLRGDPDLSAAFSARFPDGLAAENVARSIAEFERTLTTPNSALDRYLRGEEEALNEEASCGYRLFHRYGCVSCHQGINIGGNLLARFGIFGSPYQGREDLVPTDLGRYTLTGREADRRVFRVPSLRNVALTAPYFHDGSAPTLQDAVRLVARYQLGREVPARDLRCLLAFLRSLTGIRPETSP